MEKRLSGLHLENFNYKSNVCEIVFWNNIHRLPGP